MEIQKVRKFCKSKSKDDFNQLSLIARNLFIKIAQIAIITPSVKDKSFALLILKFVNEKPEKLKTVERKKAEKLLNEFNITLTGARIGDILLGITKVSNKAVIKIHHKDILTQKRDLNVLRYFPDLWDKYLDKLGSIPFFTSMSKSERQLYVSLNTDEKENAIGDNKENFEILQVGQSDFTKKLTEEQLELLLENKKLTSKEIYDIFPRKPGSRAKRNTLIMLKSFWKLSIEYEIVNEFDGMMFDISQNDNTKIIVLELPISNKKISKVGFKVDKNMINLSEFDYIEFAKDLNITDVDNLNIIYELLKALTSGSLKSLLQKLIRYRSKYVDINLDNSQHEHLIDTKIVLFITMYLLIKNVGSLVPDIQIFVSGLTSFCKRLAVISCEDSFILSSKILLSLFIGGLLSQKVKIWSPSYNIIKIWFQYGLNLLESDKCYYYDTNINIEPYYINSNNDDLKNCSAILDILKSFKGDLALVRYLATKKHKTISNDKNENRIMSIYHYIDQHCSPNFAYFYNHKVLPSDPINPLGKTFENVFKFITGINPRKKDINMKNEFVIETKNAQRLYAKMIFNKDKQLLKNINEDVYKLDYTLSNDFITGLVGTLEIKGNPIGLATLKRIGDEFNTSREADEFLIVAIRKPSRDINDAKLEDKRYEQIIEKVKEELKKGIKIKIQPFKNDTIILKELDIENTFIERNGIIMKWNEIKNLHYNIPYVEDIKLSLDNCIDYKSDGISHNGYKILDNLLINEDPLIIKRLLMYLNTRQEFIEMNKISRDGAGLKHGISILDIEVYQLLLKISLLFGYAIEATIPCEFKVKNSFLLWEIKDYVNNKYIQQIKYIEYKIDKQIERKHWEHQTISINQLKEEYKLGRKGHFIWIPVGMGKTDIVLSYLLYLNSIKQLPLYVIYTLPQSAMESIINEISKFGFNIDLIIPIKTIKKNKYKENVNIVRECKFNPNTNPNKYTIILIEHDYLRRCESELLKIAPQSIFIIDEAHKTLNDTKRTTSALEISRLSREFIALTGTPVIDSKIYKLMWWLEQIVPFELNEQNFFVAVNNMIAHKVNTGIKVDRIELPVVMDKKDLEKYQLLVPLSLGGTNKNFTHKDLKQATELCYKLCYKKMIELTIEKVNDGKGVMLVVKNSKHQQAVYKSLSKKIDKIFVLEEQDSIFLTDEAVKNKEVKDYNVVITTTQKSTGYTLTRFDTMISSIYPSNNATREQLEGRINRIGSNYKTVYYYFIHTGILTYILQNHNDAKSLSVALKAIVS